MAGLPNVGGITGPLRVPGSPGYAAPSAGIATAPTQGSDMAGAGGFSQEQMKQVAQLMMSLLSDPSMQKMLSQMAGGQAAGGAMPLGPQQPGAVQSPLAQQGLWGMPPQGGHVQWMGGMPPGYNDKVAKTLSQTAIGGNILSQLLPALLGGRR